MRQLRRFHRFRRCRRFVLLLAGAAFLKAPDALACPVCYGASDDEILKGAELSVLFMVGITYALLMGGAVLAVVLYRRRLRQLAANNETR